MRACSAPGAWHFDEADPALRTIHHVAGGHFLATGEALDAVAPPQRPAASG